MYRLKGCGVKEPLPVLRRLSEQRNGENGQRHQNRSWCKATFPIHKEISLAGYPLDSGDPYRLWFAIPGVWLLGELNYVGDQHKLKF